MKGRIGRLFSDLAWIDAGGDTMENWNKGPWLELKE